MKMSWQNKGNALIMAMAILAVLSLSAANVKAIGVTPGRTTVDFEPNLEKEVTFTIINNEHKEFSAFVYAEDELKDSITSEKNIIDFKETDEAKPFTFRFRLPEKMEKPGDHWAKVVVMEMPPGKEASEGQVVLATTAVVHQLKVRVPYPGSMRSLTSW